MKAINLANDYKLKMTVRELQLKSSSLDFTEMVQDGEVKWDDEVKIYFDLEKNYVSAIIFNPTELIWLIESHEQELIEELAKLA